VGERSSGMLFTASNGMPISQTNILKRSLYPILKAMERDKAGFHSFRRFRVTHRRKNRVSEDVLRFWIGHADKNVTDGYSKVKDDLAFRQLCAANVGLGFELPTENQTKNPMLHPNAPNCTQTVSLSEAS
jgi:hypothetical protein